MGKLEEYIKNHENAISEKKAKDSTFWGRVGLRLEFLNSGIVGSSCFALLYIIGMITSFLINADLGFLVSMGGSLLLVFIIILLKTLFFRHNEMDEEDKTQALKDVKNLSEIEKCKPQALELSEIIDKPLPRKWWNGLGEFIGETIKNNGDRETLMNTIKNNCYNEKMKTDESVALRKETVFEDRI